MSKGYGVEPNTEPKWVYPQTPGNILPLTPQRPQAASPASSITDETPVPLKLGGIGGEPQRQLRQLGTIPGTGH